MSSFFFFSSFLVKFQVVLMFQVQKKREQGIVLSLFIIIRNVVTSLNI